MYRIRYCTKLVLFGYDRQMSHICMYKKPLCMAHPIKSITDFTSHSDSTDRISRMIGCFDANAESACRLFSFDMYIDAVTIILVTKGSVEFEINRCRMRAHQNSAAVLSVTHLVRMTECSDDFEGICLMVGEDFMNEMDSVDMIYRRIRYGVKLYDKPLVEVSGCGSTVLSTRLRELQLAIKNCGHLYYKDVILNRLFAFYLDLSDIIDRSKTFTDSKHTARRESIVKKFIELLTSRYRTEHKVDYYAACLNISPHYLTQIVKEITGRSVSDFIYGMLYSESRSLLSESQMSIQEISLKLNFADQSSFGKFFKRRSGLSPLDYRKKYQ